MTARPSVTAPRQAAIDRAVTLIDTADPFDLARYLSQTNIHDHLKTNPTALRDDLTAATPDDTPSHFSAWKAAQQLLQAAGLPY